MKTYLRVTALAVFVALAAGPLTVSALVLSSDAHVSAPATATSTAADVLSSLAGFALVFGMAIKVKDTSAIAAKYVQRAGAATKDYSDGVQGAGGDWEAGAKAGEGNFEQGIQDAISRKAYGKGVNGSAGKYVANATKLGAQRYGPGVQNGAGAYQAGVQPFLDKLKSLTLPPKGPRRSPQNQARANMVAAELGKLKTGQ